MFLFLFSIEYRDDNMCVLTIYGVNPDDEGDYTVEATNESGSASCTGEFLVHMVAPEFPQPLSDITAAVDIPTLLTCEVTGLPRPEVTWFLDDSPLVESPKYHMTYEGTTATLEIAETTPVDATKTYTCKATNVAGQSTTSARLLSQGQ